MREHCPSEAEPVKPSLAPEAPDMRERVEAVIDNAFGPGRYAKVAERVRERGARFEPELSRVALEGASVLGACRIWSVSVGAAHAYFLGPLAVSPARQHEGLGAALVASAVDACREAGGAAVIAIGAHTFFGPLGFVSMPAGQVTLPGPVDPGRLLCLSLVPGACAALAGVCRAPGA